MKLLVIRKWFIFSSTSNKKKKVLCQTVAWFNIDSISISDAISWTGFGQDVLICLCFRFSVAVSFLRLFEFIPQRAEESIFEYLRNYFFLVRGCRLGCVLSSLGSRALWGEHSAAHLVCLAAQCFTNEDAFSLFHVSNTKMRSFHHAPTNWEYMSCMNNSVSMGSRVVVGNAHRRKRDCFKKKKTNKLSKAAAFIQWGNEVIYH